MKARIVWILIVVALLGGVGYRIAQAKKAQAKEAEAPAKAQLVQTTHVKKDALDERVTFTGNIRPRNEVELFTKVPGRIETLTAEVGDKVKAGQVLATVEHREIAWQSKAAEAALEVARANLASAKLDYERTEHLFKGGSAPQAQLDGAKTRLSLAQAQVAQAEASAGLSRQQVANARLETPINGTIVRRTANVGMMAGQMVPLFTVQDVATLKLESAVEASQYARLKKGAEAVVTVDGLPGEQFTGKVSLLSPSLDANTRRALVEIEVDNTSGRLLPNMFATAQVTVGRVENALVAPKDAVLLSAEGATVFRVKGGKVEAVTPKLGAQNGDRVQLLNGVSEGDELVVGGLASLADGVEVKVSNTAQADALTQNERQR